MPSTTFDPSPGQWNGSLAVGNGHDQKLMPETYFAAIHDQSDYSMTQIMDNGFCYGFIPCSHSKSRVVQKTHHATCQTGQCCTARYFLSNFTQMYRATFIQSDQKPSHVSQTCCPLSGSQLSQTLIPSMIEFADWHCSSPFTVCGNHNLPEDRANQLSFFKLSGS